MLLCALLDSDDVGVWAYAREFKVQSAFAKVGTISKMRTTGASCGGQEFKRFKVWYGLALLFFILALLAKPMAVTLPFVLLLLDFWPLQRMQFTSMGENVRLMFETADGKMAVLRPQPQSRVSLLFLRKKRRRVVSHVTLCR